MTQITKILITGAGGQIGPLLAEGLGKMYGVDNIILSDIRAIEVASFKTEILDVCDANRLKELISTHQITEIYHMAAILSAKGEQNPLKTWNINMQGLLNVFDTAVEMNLNKVFYPSSIAAFGMNIDLSSVGQNANLTPTTVYGISKSAGELWANYYFKRYNLDVRSLRYPGIISYQTLPGGGTTDYAVEIFHEAKKEKQYTSYIDKNTVLPMMYMDDAIKATLDLMHAPAASISVRTSYNLAAFSFSPSQLAEGIRKHIPGFVMNYAPDFRQKIAEGWPQVIDDKKAREDWGWQEEYDMDALIEIMLKNV